MVALQTSLYVSANDQASCFFFTNYALENADKYKTVYEYLPTLYNDTHRASPLLSIIHALGIAGLSSHRKAPELMSAARVRYDSALHLLASSLQDPVLAMADQTLISVLLMGLYETNTCDSLQSMRSWLKHISGATALLEVRGKEQLQSELGFRLFTLTRSHIYTYCVHTSTPLPETVLALSELTRHSACGKEDLIHTQLTNISVELLSLRADIATTKFLQPEAIISRALSTANNLLQWRASLPASLLPTTVTLHDSSPEVHSNYLHKYRDLFTATLLNHYRILLFLIHEIVLDHLDVLRTSYSQNSDPYAIYSLPPCYAYQAHHSKSVILDLINDICASIPYLLSYDPEDPPDPPSKRGPHAAGGNAAVWPLYVAGQLDICPTSTRTWILGRLHKIGTEMGVRQAITLEKVLRSGREVLKLMDETQDDDKDDSLELGV